MEFQTIMDKIDNGTYDEFPYPDLYEENYVFDENKSVKWNRKEVEIQNAKLLQVFNNNSKMKQANFQEDAIEYILTNYKINNNRDIANILFHIAYESSYSNEYREVLDEIIGLAELAENVVNKNKSWNEK